VDIFKFGLLNGCPNTETNRTEVRTAVSRPRFTGICLCEQYKASGSVVIVKGNAYIRAFIGSARCAATNVTSRPILLGHTVYRL